MDPIDPIRLALSPGMGLRALRWFGRLLALASLWPTWYAFYGKASFDWEAMVFGGPGVLLGLITWLWSGYRVRHPTEYVEIDRQLGEARLRKGSHSQVCSFADLGPWQVRSWRVTTTNKGVRSTSTWYAARSPGLGAHDLYQDLSREACLAWTARVDAAVRGDLVGDTGLDAALGAGLDRLLVKLEGPLGSVAMLAVLAAYVVICWRHLARTDHPQLELTIVLAVGAATFALAWRGLARPWLAAATALIAGLAFTAKPFYAPITDGFLGPPSSPTSETHFYYLIPGLALCGLAVVFALSARAVIDNSSPPPPPKPRRPEPPKPPAPKS